MCASVMCVVRGQAVQAEVPAGEAAGEEEEPAEWAPRRQALQPSVRSQLGVSAWEPRATVVTGRDA